MNNEDQGDYLEFLIHEITAEREGTPHSSMDKMPKTLPTPKEPFDEDSYLRKAAYKIGRELNTQELAKAREMIADEKYIKERIDGLGRPLDENELAMARLQFLEEKHIQADEARLGRSLDESEIARAREIRRSNVDFTKGPNASLEAMAAIEAEDMAREKATLERKQRAQAEALERARQREFSEGERVQQAQLTAEKERLVREAAFEAAQKFLLVQETAKTEIAERDAAIRSRTDVLRQQAEQEQDEFEYAKRLPRLEALAALNEQVDYDAVRVGNPKDKPEGAIGPEAADRTTPAIAEWNWGRFNPENFHAQIKHTLAGVGDSKVTSAPYNTEVFQARFISLATGNAGEVISGLFEPSELPVVYASKGIEVKKVTSLDPIFVMGGPLKKDMLEMSLPHVNIAREALERSGKNDPETQMRKAYLAMAFERLASDASRMTVMPDAFIISPTDEKSDHLNLTGVIEDKTFSSVEVEAWVANLEREIAANGKLKNDLRVNVSPADLASARERLITKYEDRAAEFNAIDLPKTEMRGFGVNLAGEVALLDIMRLSRQMPELGADALICLRFTDDIPDDLLERLGKVTETLGYKVMIQKIPFTRDEVTQIGIAKATDAMEAFLASGETSSDQFNSKEIRDIRALPFNVQRRAAEAARKAKEAQGGLPGDAPQPPAAWETDLV